MTTAMNKHLLPVYDKPMIYYPLSIMAQANIKEILLITTSNALDAFKALLGNGNQFGMEIRYAVQDRPNGVAESLVIARKFIGDDNICLILGDNFFYSQSMKMQLLQAKEAHASATLFAYRVNDPERFGVIELDSAGEPISIQEKPEFPKSNYAATGLYFYDNNAVDYANELTPSKRGELEITDINQMYLDQDKLHVHLLGEDTLWFDLGTYDSLLQAGNFVYETQSQTGKQIACIEEIALSNGWINSKEIKDIAQGMANTSYGSYLNNISSSL